MTLSRSRWEGPGESAKLDALKALSRALSKREREKEMMLS
jgi:hypothetical protein